MKLFQTTPGVQTHSKTAFGTKDTVCDHCGKKPRRVWWTYIGIVACSRLCLQLEHDVLYGDADWSDPEGEWGLAGDFY